jgi:hypothetical protein
MTVRPRQIGHVVVVPVDVGRVPRVLGVVHGRMRMDLRRPTDAASLALGRGGFGRGWRRRHGPRGRLCGMLMVIMRQGRSRLLDQAV